MDGIIAWFTTNWVNVVALLWTVDQLLKIIAPLTKSTWDDNIADMFGKILARFFQRPQ